MTGRDAPAALVETHISVITMIGGYAYKLLKPVDTGFLDHRRREDRKASCDRETEVNRRFAPDVYLGVLDVVGPTGTPADHLVHMRRMPADRCLAALLDGPAAGDLVREVARAVARLHAAAPTSAEIAHAGSPGCVLGLWVEGLGALAAGAPGVVPAADLARAGDLAETYLAGRGDLLDARVRDGWVRDGHGDLLAADVFCLPDGPRILDCLAFADRLRHGDVLGDIAFLAMDLEDRGNPGLAGVLLDEWCTALGQDHPPSLAHAYVAYRAHVRAKVAAIRATQGDPSAAAHARSLHALALDHLDRAQVRLTLVGGPPGTGKTTVARGLAEAAGWVVLGTDPIRKDLAGRPHVPADPGAFGAGAYAPAAVGAVYDEMLRRARVLLRMGESVVLDASWGDGGRRGAARALARSCGARLTEIRCALDPEVAAARILRRRAAHEGASDATPAVAARMAAAEDPWPEARDLPTGAPPDEVLARARRLAAAPQEPRSRRSMASTATTATTSGRAISTAR
ncbi:AAA family ATPase [Miltoncostaea oceani]|uniref:bifunctional aminoglycoside phosphotransferase/ATP-binding protein n=1 Tax=Miltoncostaea oceani TaxID=2843216 RepID=UPI001C3E0444|nr:AAA family ATPase [Miltoncostaea oceani]